MTPKEYKQMMNYLTRSGVRKQVKFASDIARPNPKPQVKEIELFNQFNKRNPRADGGRMEYSKGSRVSVKNVPNLFTITHSDGKKMYEAGVISKNTDLGPGLKKRFPFTEQGKKDAINAIKTHKEKYPNISKKALASEPYFLGS